MPRCALYMATWKLAVSAGDGCNRWWAQLHWEARRDFARRREQAQCLGEPKAD